MEYDCYGLLYNNNIIIIKLKKNNNIWQHQFNISVVLVGL